MRYAESGRIDLAQVHVHFMAQTGRNAIVETAELVLGPARTRLKQQMERAQQRTDKDPLQGLVATRELLDHAQRVFVLFDLFLGKESEDRNNRADEVATLCNRIILAYHKATDNNQGCHDALKLALPYAMSADLRQQIEKNIRVLQGNLTYAIFEPVVKEFEGIALGTGTPKEKLSRLKERFQALQEQWDRSDILKDALEQVENSLGMLLRNLAIAAHNEYSDMETAVEAIRLASTLVHDPEMVKRVAEDKTQITQNKATAGRHNLRLEIRSDVIEVTREKVRYNAKELPAKDINGIRFGIFTQYTNGAKSSVSYSVGVSSWNHGTINLECKRFFRSEDKAKADFNDIVNSLCHQIAPALCSRIVAKVRSGSDISFGDSRFTKEGLLVTTGMLSWKKQHLIPWNQVQFQTFNGELHIHHARDGKIKKAFSLRDCWNAVIFREIAEELAK